MTVLCVGELCAVLDAFGLPFTDLGVPCFDELPLVGLLLAVEAAGFLELFVLFGVPDLGEVATAAVAFFFDDFVCSCFFFFALVDFSCGIADDALALELSFRGNGVN